jgi:hypothetical protein
MREPPSYPALLLIMGLSAGGWTLAVLALMHVAPQVWSAAAWAVAVIVVALEALA